jgi:hypothetical protein
MFSIVIAFYRILQDIQKASTWYYLLPFLSLVGKSFLKAVSVLFPVTIMKQSLHHPLSPSGRGDRVWAIKE